MEQANLLAGFTLAWGARYCADWSETRRTVTFGHRADSRSSFRDFAQPESEAALGTGQFESDFDVN